MTTRQDFNSLCQQLAEKNKENEKLLAPKPLSISPVVEKLIDSLLLWDGWNKEFTNYVYSQCECTYAKDGVEFSTYVFGSYGKVFYRGTGEMFNELEQQAVIKAAIKGEKAAQERIKQNMMDKMGEL